MNLFWFSCRKIVNMYVWLSNNFFLRSETTSWQTHKFTYAFHRAELVGKNDILLTSAMSTDCFGDTIGAFFNGVFLLALALSIFLQSVERFVHVEKITSPKLILIIGCVGLGLNILSAIVVHGEFHATVIFHSGLNIVYSRSSWS